MPIRIFETGALMGVALDAARSIKASPRKGEQKLALISLVFSFISLEAFINEVTELALDSGKYQPPVDPPVISLFAKGMILSERCHASLETKFRLGYWILSGEELDVEAQVYKDCILLRQLRNTLLHFNPSPAFEQSTPPEEVYQKLFKRLGDKNILAEDARGCSGTWTFLVETKAVAEWSCRTAAQMIVNFCPCVPQSTLKAFSTHFERAFAADNLFRTLKSSL